MQDNESEREEEAKETESRPFEEMNELEKCIEVGRVGPAKTGLDQDSSSGKVTDNELLLEGASREFNSIRADTGFFKGVWYFEATLRTDGLM